ncbi:hypothetical protein [Paraburkholderia adhaesiva]|uniref:hypothetical protein n=1 Tax=Paraburkholderia adhaesiva TaxID=2883244 RepID=UPI001F2ADE3F|nr:hypothetical protein [Paraburkholderia adhaesiva]
MDLGLGNVSSLAGQLVSLSYGRDMERVTDLRGAKYLEASGLRSDGWRLFLCVASGT